MGVQFYAYLNSEGEEPYQINSEKREEEDKAKKDKDSSDRKARTLKRLQKAKAKAAEKERYKKSEKIIEKANKLESTLVKS